MVERSTLNYPPVVIEDQLDTMIDEFERQLRQYGIESLETYLRQTGGGTIEEYRERLRPEALKLAEQNLILSEVLRAEKLAVSDEEIAERIKELMGGDQMEDDESARSVAEMLSSGAGRTILESQILREKALQRLLAIARGEEVPPVPADEPPAADAEPAVEAPAEASVDAI
jgi:trigger factor